MRISIIDLQYFQQLHDCTYHGDIYYMPLMKRLDHLYKHMIKYNRSDLNRFNTYSDSFACILSMANALNLDLSKGIEESQDRMIVALNDVDIIYNLTHLNSKTTSVLSKMAKLLESHDHVESLKYKEDFKAQVVDLMIVFIHQINSDELNVNEIIKNYVKNIFELKKKHIFFPHYHASQRLIPVYRSFENLLLI